MAVIAIFCDGTWNTFDGPNRTHVARLAEACVKDDAQKVIYIEGVGTGTGTVSQIGRTLSKLGGGVFGWGLNRNIKLAYLELCRCYRPGDKIMVFGFSRGAYTARSLVGMIRKCGILRDPNARNLRRAFRLYRTRGWRGMPDSHAVWEKRRRLSPNFATSAEDVIRRADHSFLVRITYLGVWDTVGALGIPKGVLGPLASVWNARYAFHDTRLTRLVEEARHAVALDEKRVLFEPSLWSNLDVDGDDPGLNRGDRTAERRYQQVWFAGNHSVVGGASAPQALANASLEWIWQAAKTSGLRLKTRDYLPVVPVDAAAPAPDIYDVNKAYAAVPWLLRWRHGPERSENLHPTARLRAALLPGYRPRTLKTVMAGLFAKKESALRL
ncbi:MAG: DUF2235 domain-containing protein [Pseudomonadota bacterium]